MWIFHDQKSWNLDCAIWIQEFSDEMIIKFPDNHFIRLYGTEKTGVLNYLNKIKDQNRYWEK